MQFWCFCTRNITARNLLQLSTEEAKAYIFLMSCLFLLFQVQEANAFQVLFAKKISFLSHCTAIPNLGNTAATELPTYFFQFFRKTWLLFLVPVARSPSLPLVSRCELSQKRTLGLKPMLILEVDPRCHTLDNLKFTSFMSTFCGCWCDSL